MPGRTARIMADTKAAWRERVALANELERRVAEAKESCRRDSSAYFAGQLAALDEVWCWLVERDRALGGVVLFALKEAGAANGASDD